MSRLLRKTAYGPGHWCKAGDVLNLKRPFFFPGEFRHLGLMAQAAMLRTDTYENTLDNGLKVALRERELRQAYSSTPYFDRSRQWSEWYAPAPIIQMQALR